MRTDIVWSISQKASAMVSAVNCIERLEFFAVFIIWIKLGF